MTNQTETPSTLDQIVEDLNASSDAYLLRISDDGGFYGTSNSTPTYWDDVRDDARIVALVDSPLLGWATDTSDIEMGWSGADVEHPRTVSITWHHAVRVEQDGHTYTAFVGQGDLAPAPVTVAAVRALLTSTGMEPTLVRWADSGDVEVVSGVLFTDISYSNYNREHEVLATPANLKALGDWDTEHPTEDDYRAFAQMLNEGEDA